MMWGTRSGNSLPPDRGGRHVRTVLGGVVVTGGRAAPGPAAVASLTFVAPAALDDGLPQRLGLAKAMVAVADVRQRGKADLPENSATPDIRVAPDTFTVTIDGEAIEATPVTELPMAQRYFLF